MKRSLGILLALAAIIVATGVHATTYTVWTGSPSGQSTGVDQMRNYPDKPATNRLTSIATTATTTAQVVTNLAGRKKITFIPDIGGTEGVIWIMVGSTTAVVQTGIPLATNPKSGTTALEFQDITPLTLDLDASVPVGYVSSTAARVTVLQTGNAK